MNEDDFVAAKENEAWSCIGCCFDNDGECTRPSEFSTCKSYDHVIWIKKESEVPQEPIARATDKQEGGNHYKTAIQPVDYIHANSLDFFEGNVVKYVTRHKKKNGAEDIRKAIHYLEMILQFQYPKETK